VLSVGVSREASGFGRQLGSMFAHLADRYEVHHVGIDYLGGRIDGGWTIHPAAGPSDIDGCGAIATLAPVLRPAVVLVTNDLWKVGPAVAAAVRLALINAASASGAAPSRKRGRLRQRHGGHAFALAAMRRDGGARVGSTAHGSRPWAGSGSDVSMVVSQSEAFTIVRGRRLLA
jgi:hypothetical protein